MQGRDETNAGETPLRAALRATDGGIGCHYRLRAEVGLGVETLATHPGLRDDLQAFASASYLADLVRTLTQDDEPNERVYALLSETLALLSDGVDAWALTRYFEYALLEASGFQAQLHECPICREAVTEQANAFSVREGGVICPRCRATDPGAVALSVNAQKYLRTMQRDGLGRLLTLKLDEASRQQVERALTDYVQHVAERPISSLAVLHALQVRAPESRPEATTS